MVGFITPKTRIATLLWDDDWVSEIWWFNNQIINKLQLYMYIVQYEKADLSIGMNNNKWKFILFDCWREWKLYCGIHECLGIKFKTIHPISTPPITIANVEILYWIVIIKVKFSRTHVNRLHIYFILACYVYSGSQKVVHLWYCERNLNCNLVWIDDALAFGTGCM